MWKRLWSSSLCGILIATGFDVGLADDREAAIKAFDTQVTPSELRESVANEVQSDLSRKLREANERSTAEWRAIQDRAGWEKFRAEKLAALKRSLGRWPEPPKSVSVRVSSTIEGDGFRIDNILFESRPGWWVSANLYRPAKPREDSDKPREAMPGIVICHAHHTPKEHGELQDMGMTWARAGCIVLVPDQVGHGERRQHPFAAAASFDKPFRVGHADYYFRYDNAMQLHLVGESLIGWMAWDMMRGIDVLLAQPGIDRSKIILLGAVAGGGDPAAVTGALDERFAAVVPFNFGGPQPETRFPLPDDAEMRFNYAGSGSWESTRNLQRSAADGSSFLPWVIVGGIAPRRLVYAHEFKWDEPRDPVWKRFQTIYGWYEHPDFLASTRGSGAVTGSSSQDTHCTHIGRVHRVSIHAAFRSWFGIDVTSESEFSSRGPSDRLRCWTPELKQELQPKSLAQMTTVLADSMIAEVTQKQSALSRQDFRRELQVRWKRLLGDIEPAKIESAVVTKTQSVGDAKVESVLLTTSADIRIPLLWFVPKSGKSGRSPVVVVCSQGKSRWLKERTAELTQLLSDGRAVCLVDPRGIGESKLGDSHGRRSSATSLSSSALMLGTPLLGQQLSDLRTALTWLREQPVTKGQSLELRGESLIPPNPDTARFRQPRDDDSALPAPSEPQAPLLALLTGLFDDDIAAIQTQGNLASWKSLFASYLVLTSHAAIVPDVLSAGDIDQLIAAQRQSTKVSESNRVDAWNRATGPSK